MPSKLKQLMISHVALVDKGANPDAHIVLFKRDGIEKATWTTAYINTLPDSSFAVIEPEGEKDDEGKTTPRSLRHLPYKDADGNVDLPHLRNALARLPQTNLSDDLKARAGRRLRAAARQAGVEVSMDKMYMGDIDEPMTTDEIIEYQREHERLCREWWEVQDAFRTAIESITRHGDDAERPMMLRQSTEEFVARAVPILEAMGMLEKAQSSVEEIKMVAKAGKKISSARMRRLKEAMDTLSTIIQEAENMPANLEKLQEQIDELTGAVDTLKGENADLKKRNEELQAEINKRDEPTDPEAKRKAALAKMDPETRAIFEEQEAVTKSHADRIAKAEAEAEKARGEVRKREAIAKARTYTSLPVNPDDHYSIFMKIDAGEALDEKERETLYSLLRSADELAAQGGVFNEFGKGGGGDGNSKGDAAEQVQKMAKAKVEKDANLSLNDAMDEVFRENPALYQQYRQENFPKV